MRSTPDRVRHAISFEIIGLILVLPLGMLAFGFSMLDLGVVEVGATVIATGWNYLYNLAFDLVMRWRTGGTKKPLAIRILHAVLFEAGLMVLTTPFIAWYLGIGLVHALVMDIAFAVFYLGYAFVFNWAYDALFPLPEWQKAA